MVEDVNISYQRGLEEQADCLANQIGQLIAHVEESTGLDIRLSAKAYLLRLDEAPYNYNMRFKLDPNHFAIPMFVRAGEESCEAIVASNFIYPGLFMHEMAEMSLIFHKPPGVVLPDAAGKFLVFKPKLLNYTRWFRDGMANYAAYLAYLKLRLQIEAERPPTEWAIHSHPFSSLDKVGTKLFKWHQYSPARWSDDYYNAALGLFLLVTDQFGPDSIKNIFQRINQQDYLNGKDLIKIFDEVLGVDFKQLVREYHFPRTGLRVRGLTRALALNEGLEVETGLFVYKIDPNGLASDSGLKEKDVIIKIGDAPVECKMDMEWALFKSRDEAAVDVTLWRKDTGETILTLKLKED